MLYGNTGFIDLIDIIDLNNTNISFILGITLIIISILFKIGAAPFHLWLPDAYQGASYEILLFISIFPKIFLFALLDILTKSFTNISYFLLIPVILSAIIGSVQAIQQIKIKRFIAYTIIYNNAFFLAVIIIASTISYLTLIGVLILYLIGSILNLLPFWSLKNPYNLQFTSMRELISLRTSNFWYAIVLMVGFLSSLGVPPLMGFFTKYFVFSALIEQHFTIIAIFLVLAAILPAFYYLRIITTLFFLPKSLRIFLITISEGQALFISIIFIISFIFILYAPRFLAFILL